MKGSKAMVGSCKKACSSASSSHSVPRGLKCACGKEVVLLMSNTPANPGRLFLRCRNWAWLDEDDTMSDGNLEATQMMQREMDILKRKNEKLKKKLASERWKGTGRPFL
ncbi:hypothetical protein SESBI_07178 [Sesbania bispinosa]|nr:hypothetical protein SESBI_07178 [Sesbania bispinosa]